MSPAVSVFHFKVLSYQLILAFSIIATQAIAQDTV